MKLTETEEESVELREAVIVTVAFSDKVPLAVKLLVSLLVLVTLLENVLVLVSFSVPEKQKEGEMRKSSDESSTSNPAKGVPFFENAVNVLRPQKALLRN